MAEFRITELEPAPFAYVTRTCAAQDVGRVVSETFAQLSAAFATAGARPQGAPMAHFSPAADDRVHVELGFPVDEHVTGPLHIAGLNIAETYAGRAMCAVHGGDYTTLRETYDAMIAAIRDAGMKPAADMWERYGGEGEAVQVEVIWPLAR
ncbi:MAG TPA: GyrI-like domain-containing protein [Terricaulis sp.]|nr:GyrI-like domain-containing protein [Terricaulis sp.]HRP10554.1 GyrI-like domain-containing protein [Terricaulis sp.]